MKRFTSFFAAFLAFLCLTAPAQAKAPIKIERYRLSDAIDDDSVVATIKHLRQAESHDVTAFILEINTPGGSVPAGFELSKAIENAKVPVVCVVDGMAASMGAYILQSCSFRVMTTRSVLMFHEPSFSGLMSGTPNDWQAMANALRALHNAMAWHCVHRMKISVEVYHQKVDGGLQWWLDWEEAMVVGAIDAPAESVQQVIDAISR